MAKAIMIQGTMSNVGKSLLTAGLCRIFRRDGYRAVPFKSQNMALNSFVTEEGLEMGRAQAMQAEAAGIRPDIRMNPILLKPSTDTGSQVILMGEVLGDMDARRYFSWKKNLLPVVLDAYRSLAEENDIIVIEGAGSPAELNLKQDDIVNMGLAEAVGAPVLLVGDIDRGGVFAQLLGTQMLLAPGEQSLLKGLIVNKFRGDKSLFDPGVKMLEERSGLPVVGVVPYMQVDLDDEDSLSPRLDRTNRPRRGRPVEIAVIRLPRLSNFTDLNAFAGIPEADLRYVSHPDALFDGMAAVSAGRDGACVTHRERGVIQTAPAGGEGADPRVSIRRPAGDIDLEQKPLSPGIPDMIILPGTKNTIEDLHWLRESGMAEAVDVCRRRGSVIFGICGGFQMLGRTIADPCGVEAGGTAAGLGYLDAETVFETGKRRTRVRGRIGALPGILQPLQGMEIEGYEIHMGRTRTLGEDVFGQTPFAHVTDLMSGSTAPDGLAAGNVYGTYIHGIFDAEGIAAGIVRILADRKGISLPFSFSGEAGPQKGGQRAYREKQYDLLADTLRRHLDMDKIYAILEEGRG